MGAWGPFPWSLEKHFYQIHFFYLQNIKLISNFTYLGFPNLTSFHKSLQLDLVYMLKLTIFLSLKIIFL